MTVVLKNVASGLNLKKLPLGPTVGAGYAKGLLNFAVSLGADRAVLLRRGRIEAADLDNPDNRVALDSYLALLNAGAEMTREPALALKYGQAVRMQDISIVGLICEACETTMDVGTQLNRYGRLVYDTRDGKPTQVVQLTRNDAGLWMEAMHEAFIVHPVVAEAEFARLVWNIKAMFGATEYLKENPFPLEVHFAHQAPSYADEFERIFNAPVKFGTKWNAMRFHQGFITLRQPPINRYVFGVLSDKANALLKSLENSKTVRGQVEGMLIPDLHKGDPSVERVAEKMGLSRQTLYRKLKAEGATFEKLLDELRHKMALHYLNGKKVSVNETAYLVGFSDPSAFSRAFKRWTGASPRTVRAAT